MSVDNLRYAPSGYGWEEKGPEKEIAQAQNQTQKTRRLHQSGTLRVMKSGHGRSMSGWSKRASCSKIVTSISRLA